MASAGAINVKEALEQSVQEDSLIFPIWPQDGA